MNAIYYIVGKLQTIPDFGHSHRSKSSIIQCSLPKTLNCSFYQYNQSPSEKVSSKKPTPGRRTKFDSFPLYSSATFFICLYFFEGPALGGLPRFLSEGVDLQFVFEARTCNPKLLSCFLCFLLTWR